MIRIRVLLSVSGSGSDFFPESGSGGSAKNPDPIRIHEKNAQKLSVQVKKMIIFSFLRVSTLSFLVRFLQNLIKGHNLDPIRLLKQKTDGSESAKKPGSGTLLRNSLVSDLSSD